MKLRGLRLQLFVHLIAPLHLGDSLILLFITTEAIAFLTERNLISDANGDEKCIELGDFFFKKQTVRYFFSLFLNIYMYIYHQKLLSVYSLLSTVIGFVSSQMAVSRTKVILLRVFLLNNCDVLSRTDWIIKVEEWNSLFAKNKKTYNLFTVFVQCLFI